MYFQSLLFIGTFLGLVSAKVQYVGVNIAGFEFGCGTDGTCPLSSSQGALTTLGGGDGEGQMQHFVTNDQMNIFRLPVSWQFLTNDVIGTLDATNFAAYDQLMQACLATGASCAIDLHNYARFNGDIIGQSTAGPTNAQFADLWTQLATKYASSTKVVFGLMNEPHDLDITTWAATCQAVVTAVRGAGATNMILLPGTDFASAATVVSSGSAAALSNITNPDGTFDNLVLDLHKYLDVDNSGSHSTCTTDNIADAFQLAADFLRTNGRMALVSETGAGTDATCFTDFCAQNAFLNQNSDVFLGYVAWAAGSFDTSYILSLTPTGTSGNYVDTALASQCVIAPWLDATSVISSAIASATTPAGSASSVADVATTTPIVIADNAAATPTLTLTLTSTTSNVVAIITKTFSIALSNTPQAAAITVDTGSYTSMTMGATPSWSNGTATLTAATVSGSSGSGSATTSSALAVVTANGAGMRTLAKRLMFGSAILAVLL